LKTTSNVDVAALFEGFWWWILNRSIDQSINRSSMHARPVVRNSKAESAGARQGETSRTHLIVLANGLWGRSRHWSTVSSYITQELGTRQHQTAHRVYVSTANQGFQTYRGVDVGGDRLKKELDELVRREHPDADAVSFIGHSMGGLIARNAIAKAFDRETGKLLIGGRELEPRHYISLATPHVGFGSDETCPLDRAWYIPFSRFLVPLVSSRVLGAAGRQFFLSDKEKVILRMASHVELEGLRAFRTRTLYANVSGDHLVGWANSSLRFAHELEDVRARIAEAQDAEHRGVVLEDDVALAMAEATCAPSSVSVPESQADAMANLCALGWRRIDCSFRNSRLPGVAHQHIMVQRPLVNGVGRKTAMHLAEQIGMCVV
jgi:pimeloyl-ACP methyl ester carboxylesterase